MMKMFKQVKGVKDRKRISHGMKTVLLYLSAPKVNSFLVVLQFHLFIYSFQ